MVRAKNVMPDKRYNKAIMRPYTNEYKDYIMSFNISEVYKFAAKLYRFCIDEKT